MIPSTIATSALIRRTDLKLKLRRREYPGAVLEKPSAHILSTSARPFLRRPVGVSPPWSQLTVPEERTGRSATGAHPVRRPLTSLKRGKRDVRASTSSARRGLPSRSCDWSQALRVDTRRRPPDQTSRLACRPTPAARCRSRPRCEAGALTARRRARSPPRSRSPDRRCRNH